MRDYSKKKPFINKQQLWAERNGIRMNENGNYRYFYALNPDENIFNGLSEETRKWFMDADGNELADSENGYPPKMSALHSSSALCVNVFQYFMDKPELACALFRSCGLIGDDIKNDDDVKVNKMQFECKDYPIKTNPVATPNIDLVADLEFKGKNLHIIAESKFTEPYVGEAKNFLSDKYYGKNSAIWREANLFQLYLALKTISVTYVDENGKRTTSGRDEYEKLMKDGKRIRGQFVFPYRYLDAVQLIKHLLGAALKYQDQENIRLLYIWYDTFDFEGVAHRREIEEFKTFIESNTEAKFHHITYQELIRNLSSKLNEEHSAYLNYISDRYL